MQKNNAILQCLCFLRNAVILRKVSKIVATRCQILRLKCTKFDFCVAYSSPPDLLAVFKGSLLRGGKGKEGERKGGGTDP